MNTHEMAEVINVITGFWTVSNERAKGMARWLHERGVSVHDARAALSDLAEQYDQLPSIKQLGVKLAEIGASTKPEIGVGSPAVIEHMKSRILEFARSAAQVRNQSLPDRLRDELAAVTSYLQEAIEFGMDDDTTGWYRDQQQALRELLIGDRTGAR